MANNGRVLLAATVTDVGEGPFVYPACEQCYSKLTVSQVHGCQLYRCQSCRQVYNPGQENYRYRLCLSVTDSTTLVSVTGFGGMLNSFFGVAATEFHNSYLSRVRSKFGASCENIIQVAVEQALVGQRLLFGLKTSLTDVKLLCAKEGGITLKDICQNVDVWSQRSTARHLPVFIAVQIVRQTDSAAATTVVECLHHLMTILEENNLTPDIGTDKPALLQHLNPCSRRDFQDLLIPVNIPDRSLLPSTSSQFDISLDLTNDTSSLQFSCDRSQERTNVLENTSFMMCEYRCPVVDNPSVCTSNVSSLSSNELLKTCCCEKQSVISHSFCPKNVNYNSFCYENMNTSSIHENMNTSSIHENMNTSSIHENMNTSSIHENMNTNSICQEDVNTDSICKEEMNTDSVCQGDKNTNSVCQRDKNTNSVCQEDKNTDSVCQGDKNTDSVCQEDVNTDSVCQGDKNTDSVCQGDKNTDSVCQGNKNTQLVCQKDKNTNSVCQGNKNTDSVCQGNKNTDSVCQGNKNTDSVCQGNKNTDSVCQGNKNTQLVCQKDKNTQLVCQKDKITNSVCQEDKNTDSVCHEDVNTDSVCQEDKNTDSVCHEDVNTDSVCQEHVNTDSVCQGDENTDSVCQGDENTHSVCQGDKNTHSVCQGDKNTHSVCQEDVSMKLQINANVEETESELSQQLVAQRQMDCLQSSKTRFENIANLITKKTQTENNHFKEMNTVNVEDDVNRPDVMHQSVLAQGSFLNLQAVYRDDKENKERSKNTYCHVRNLRRKSKSHNSGLFCSDNSQGFRINKMKGKVRMTKEHLLEPEFFVNDLTKSGKYTLYSTSVQLDCHNHTADVCELPARDKITNINDFSLLSQPKDCKSLKPSHSAQRTRTHSAQRTRTHSAQRTRTHSAQRTRTHSAQRTRTPDADLRPLDSKRIFNTQVDSGHNISVFPKHSVNLTVHSASSLESCVQLNLQSSPHNDENNETQVASDSHLKKKLKLCTPRTISNRNTNSFNNESQISSNITLRRSKRKHVEKSVNIHKEGPSNEKLHCKEKIKEILYRQIVNTEKCSRKASVTDIQICHENGVLGESVVNYGNDQFSEFGECGQELAEDFMEDYPESEGIDLFLTQFSNNCLKEHEGTRTEMNKFESYIPCTSVRLSPSAQRRAACAERSFDSNRILSKPVESGHAISKGSEHPVNMPVHPTSLTENLVQSSFKNSPNKENNKTPAALSAFCRAKFKLCHENRVQEESIKNCDNDTFSEFGMWGQESPGQLMEDYPKSEGLDLFLTQTSSNCVKNCECAQIQTHPLTNFSQITRRQARDSLGSSNIYQELQEKILPDKHKPPGFACVTCNIQEACTDTSCVADRATSLFRTPLRSTDHQQKCTQTPTVGDSNKQTPPETIGNSVKQTSSQSVKNSVKQTSTQSVKNSSKHIPTQSVKNSIKHTPTQSVKNSIKQTSTQSVKKSIKETPAQRVKNSIKQTPTQRVKNSIKQTPTQRVKNSIKQTPTQRVKNSIKQTPTQRVKNSIKQTPTQRVKNSIKQTPLKNVDKRKKQTLLLKIKSLMKHTLPQKLNFSKKQTSQNTKMLTNENLSPNVNNSQNYDLIIGTKAKSKQKLSLNVKNSSKHTSPQIINISEEDHLFHSVKNKNRRTLFSNLQNLGKQTLPRNVINSTKLILSDKVGCLVKEPLLQNVKNPKKQGLPRCVNNNKKQTLYNNDNTPRKQTLTQNVKYSKKQNLAENINNSKKQILSINIKHRKNQTLTQNVSNPKNQNLTQNVCTPKKHNLAQNVSNPKKQNLAQNVSNPKKQNLAQNVSNPKKQNLAQNVCTPKKQNLTQNVCTTKKQNLTQNVCTPKKQNLAQNVSNPKKQNLPPNVTNSKKMILSQNVQNPNRQTQSLASSTPRTISNRSTNSFDHESQIASNITLRRSKRKHVEKTVNIHEGGPSNEKLFKDQIEEMLSREITNSDQCSSKTSVTGTQNGNSSAKFNCDPRPEFHHPFMDDLSLGSSDMCSKKVHAQSSSKCDEELYLETVDRLASLGSSSCTRSSTRSQLFQGGIDRRVASLGSTSCTRSSIRSQFFQGGIDRRVASLGSTSCTRSSTRSQFFQGGIDRRVASLGSSSCTRSSIRSQFFQGGIDRRVASLGSSSCTRSSIRSQFFQGGIDRRVASLGSSSCTRSSTRSQFFQGGIDRRVASLGSSSCTRSSTRSQFFQGGKQRGITLVDSVNCGVFSDYALENTDMSVNYFKSDLSVELFSDISAGSVVSCDRVARNVDQLNCGSSNVAIHCMEISKQNQLMAEISKEDCYAAEISKQNGYSGEISKQNGNSAEISKQNGYSAEISKQNGYSAEISKQNGYSAEISKQNGYSAEIFKDKKLEAEITENCSMGTVSLGELQKPESSSDTHCHSGNTTTCSKDLIQRWQNTGHINEPDDAEMAKPSQDDDDEDDLEFWCHPPTPQNPLFTKYKIGKPVGYILRSQEMFNGSNKCGNILQSTEEIMQDILESCENIDFKDGTSEHLVSDKSHINGTSEHLVSDKSHINGASEHLVSDKSHINGASEHLLFDSSQDLFDDGSLVPTTDDSSINSHSQKNKNETLVPRSYLLPSSQTKTCVHVGSNSKHPLASPPRRNSITRRVRFSNRKLEHYFFSFDIIGHLPVASRVNVDLKPALKRRVLDWDPPGSPDLFSESYEDTNGLDIPLQIKPDSQDWIHRWDSSCELFSQSPEQPIMKDMPRLPVVKEAFITCADFYCDSGRSPAKGRSLSVTSCEEAKHTFGTCTEDFQNDCSFDLYMPDSVSETSKMSHTTVSNRETNRTNQFSVLSPSADSCAFDDCVTPDLFS